jgi:DNA-binding beta-propeller fold protein YncE
VQGTRRGRARVPVSMIAVALLAAGCASGHRRLAAVPEPATAPAVRAHPPGLLLSVGGQPEGIAVDHTTATVAVAVRDPAAIVLIRLRSLAVERRIPLDGAARHIALASAGGPLLVPAESTDRLYQLSLPHGRVLTQTTVGRQPHDAADAGGRVFVRDEFSDTVSVVAHDALVQTLAAPTQPGGLAATPDGSTVVVVGVRARRIAAYRADGQTLASLPAGVGPTHVVAGSHGQFYVADTQGDAVLVFASSGETIHQVSRIRVGGAPYGLATDTQHDRLYVTTTASNQLLSFRIDGPRLIPDRRWPTPRQPNSVAADPATGRVYVAGAADGVIQVLAP